RPYRAESSADRSPRNRSKGRTAGPAAEVGTAEASVLLVETHAFAPPGRRRGGGQARGRSRCRSGLADAKHNAWRRAGDAIPADRETETAKWLMTLANCGEALRPPVSVRVRSSTFGLAALQSPPWQRASKSGTSISRPPAWRTNRPSTRSVF